jgi:hypothetical protein
MKTNLTRRMFLRGTGATFAIPFLPSLASRAFASEDPSAQVGRRFFTLRTDHGDVWGDNMYPSDTLLTNQMPYAGRTVNYGLLPTHPSEGADKLIWSPVCTASPEYLTPNVAGKMNILRGIDVPFAIGHQSGINLGNFGASSIPMEANIKVSYSSPTIDQVMAYSPTFYDQPDLQSRVFRRSFMIGNGLSWGYSRPSERSGRIIPKQAFTKSEVLYNYLFNGAASLNGWDEPLLNRVIDNYHRLSLHPRLANADRVRLEQHMDRTSDLQRLLSVASALEANIAESPGATGDSQAYHRNNQLPFAFAYIDAFIQVIVSALSTGVSRVGTWNLGETHFTDHNHPGDWHTNVAHNGLGAMAAQRYTIGYNQGAFEYIFAKLAKELDAVTMADGQTLLDHSLLVFCQEHGQITHHSRCNTTPIVTAGRAGGSINTGHFIDFSDRDRLSVNLGIYSAEKPGIQDEYAGLYYNQFLANCLSAMGIPASEWEGFTEMTTDGPTRSRSTAGYAPFKSGGDAYLQAENVLGDPLPVFTE